ncbi:MAG TPA: 1-acyl-sn-glycerol-3-phosphate acyltransferase [Thermoanaerobaculia bacterium]|nr:1-acyl-sn-glycerol-3-phosphate acyltransferase [Thermoanaerobaculia bacterium]
MSGQAPDAPHAPAVPAAPPPAADCYDPFDPDYVGSLIDEAVEPLCRHYFRPVLLGAERLPRRGPLVLAPNHSGNAFPYDGLLLDALLWEHEGRPRQGKIRSVYEKELAVTWWMRPFGLDNFWRRCGGIDLTFDNFDRLLARGERLIYYPEGVPGIGKGFFRRYRLQRFSSSFVIHAARHGAPVFPVYVVNAEWVLPFCFTVRPLDRLVQRLWRVPFLPLPAAPLALLFPWLWYFALPSRMVFVVGEAIDVRQMVADAGLLDPGGLADLDESGRAVLRKVAEQVRRRCQIELEQQVGFHGRRPYDLRLLARELWQGRRKLARILPTGWAVSFNRHQRNRRRAPARNRLHAVLRDWDLVLFYLPFGWPLLGLARSLRRPPCGFRGVGAGERREIEGSFHWRLAERPLPPQIPPG